MRRPITAARLILLLSVALLAAADAHRASAHLSPAPSAPFADCEGDACSQVTLAFDDTKQQYRAQNNSADRWAKVAASNVAASASACLAPGAGDYLPLKSIVGNYQAAYAEPKCGMQGGE